MANIYQKFGERVRELRKDRGLSEEKLAEKMKLKDVRTIVAIETGKRNPTLKTINKITKALDKTLKDFF